jgi:hypothetical protein
LYGILNESMGMEEKRVVVKHVGKEVVVDNENV